MHRHLQVHGTGSNDTQERVTMAEKDMTEKALEAFNDVFADILNNLLFHGQKRIPETELEQGRERSIYRGEKSLREQERDTSKYWRKNNIRIAYIGLENETEAEDDMPLRIIGYDGAAYRDQIAYEKDPNGIRKKTPDRYPVVTLVLYFGYQKHWTKARTLYEAIGDHMDHDLMPFVNDYRINLFEIAWLTDEQVSGFQSDFGIVADYFVQMRKTGTYNGSVRDMRHMREVLQLLSVLTDDSRFLETAESAKKGDAPKNMCEVLDRIENRGREQGIEQGIKQGEINNAKKVAFRLNRKGLPVEDIADIVEFDINIVSSWIQSMSADAERCSQEQ